MSEATKQIDKELEAYRKKAEAEKPETIYQQAMQHIFTEGTAYYARELVDASDELAQMVIAEGKTLADCTTHVIQYAKRVCGGVNGDLPTEDFHKAIWEYYRMPVEKAKTAIADAKKRRTAEQAEKSKKWAEEAKARAEKAAAEKAQEAVAKRQATGQMSMFEMFQAGTKPAPKEEPVVEKEQQE